MRSATGAILLVLLASGCSRPDSAAPAAAVPADAPDISSSDLQSDPQLRYFHEHLVVEGEDLQSAFGGDLLTLGMNPRDLQQDDPRHAYLTVLAEVQKVADPAVRREMMATFFNAADAR